jgi:hypothetical protein
MTESTTILRTAKTYARDLAERVIATFLVALGAVFLAAEPAGMFTLSFWEGAATAGFAAVGSLLKGLFARLSGDKNSASADSSV